MKSIYENSPPQKPAKPNGALNGKVGVEYEYSTSTTDPDIENIYYFFDWGDGSNSGWFGPYSSGEIVEASHTWSEQDSYEIITIAQDISGTISEWSDPLQIEIERKKQRITIPFLQFLQNFLENHPHLFPILRLLLQRLEL